MEPKAVYLNLKIASTKERCFADGYKAIDSFYNQLQKPLQMGRLLTAVVASLVMALAVIFLLPLAFGTNPIDMLKGKAKIETTTQQNIITTEPGETAVEAVLQKVIPSGGNFAVPFVS